MSLRTDNILIVDDILENIQRAGAALMEEGYRVSFADSGKKALELCEAKDFDLILLDIMMPGMDGYEVISILKDTEKTKEIPVIFLTAKTETEDLVKGFRMGAVDYITKPFKNEELLVRAQTHLLIAHQKKELSDLNLQKDKFFSIIAHDLRSPQNAIMGLSELLKNNWEDFTHEDKQEMVDVLHQSANSFGHLLEELLTWARMQMGKAEVQPLVLDLKELADVLLPLYKAKAEDGKVLLINDLPEDSRVWADSAMLQGCMRNLLTNAIKFTPEGGSVTLSCKSEGDFLELSVQDTGIGIKAKDIGKLFRMDEWHTTPSLKGEKGTGLGLLLVKEFAETNGGEVGVESEPEQGTRFFFTIPRPSTS